MYRFAKTAAKKGGLKTEGTGTKCKEKFKKEENEEHVQLSTQNSLSEVVGASSNKVRGLVVWDMI